jgi:hypothetical protein
MLFHRSLTDRAQGHGKGGHYLMRFRPQASLISKAAIIKIVATTIGPDNIANTVSILQFPQRQAKRASEELVPN